MALFLLIRHGENDFVKKGLLAGRLPEVHLNRQGLTQANTIAAKLTGAPVTALYSSPLERAMETARPIAEKLELEVIPNDGLIELNVGEWQGQKIKGLSRTKIWKAVQAAPSCVTIPGGESFTQAQCRIVHELDKLAEKHKEDKLVVCVSHSDPIKLAVAHYLGLPLDLFQRIHISPASLTLLQIGGMGSRLLTLNYDLSFSFLQT